MRKDAKRLTALLMVLSMMFGFVPTMRTQAAGSEETGSGTTVSYTNEVDVTLYVGEFATFEVNAAAASTEINSSIATAEIGDAYDAQLGTGASYDGDYINLEDALYTFTYDESESGWIISNTTSDGTTVYVNIDNSDNGYPNNTTKDVLTLTWNTSYFTITNGNGRNLAFLTDSTKPYFDEGNFGVTPTVANEGYAKLIIYCPVADGETDSEELPGYVKVTSLDGIKSGSRYLIAAYRNEAYYVLYPSTSTSSKFAHVAKALGSVKAQMTVTGVAEGTTSVAVGDTLYHITVPETAGTATKTLEGGASATLGITDIDSDFTLTEGSTVTWTIGDTDIASLYNTNGASTSLVAHAAGMTNVIAKVYDGSGDLKAVYVWTITVTSTYGAGDYTFTWTVTEKIYNGTLYYSVDGGELIEATVEDESTDADGNKIRTYTISQISEDVTNTGLIYFIKPDEGYATTYVYDNDGNTYSQFYGAKTLRGYYDSATYLSDYPEVKKHSGGWPTDIMSHAEWDALTAKAIAVGCDAVYWNTRNISADGYKTFSYTNYCNKLPTVEKKITSLTRTESGVSTTISYIEGETEVKVGDVIHYTVSVTTYYENEDIVYSNAVLKDSMSSGSGEDATFADDNAITKEVTDVLGNGVTQTDASKVAGTYEVTYTVTQADLDSELLNTVSLSYDYSTGYSTGSYGGTASAACRVNLVSSFTPYSVVVDFDLPVTVDYSETDHGSYDLVSGTATYGTVTIEDNKVTYKPDSVLTGVDTVTLVNKKNATYTFDVYPATTVYYEESFASYGNGWDLAGDGSWSFNDSKSRSGTESQETHEARDENTTFNNYNYDEAYASDTEGSGGTAATTTTKGDTLSFTFTGTGVDIFANCDSGSGRVTIRLTDSNGTAKQFLFVDMANSGTYGTGDSTIAYNTPIASISGLDYGSYTVDIYLAGVGTSGFQFDGFRVYDTIEQSETKSADAYTVQNEVYRDDDEDYPVYYELRNSVLAGISADTSTSTYAEDLTKTLAQVYATSGTGEGAIVVYDTSSEGIMLTGTTAQDILDDGPKNELYLYPGTAVVFKVTTSRKVQIGMRSVTGAEVSYSVSAVDSDEQTILIAGTTSNGSMTSSVDMFYDLVAKSGTETTYIITIQNTGSDGILSITDIKISDSSDSAVFEELTTEEVVAALENSGASEATQTDAGEAGSASEETETDTGEEDSALEETGTDTGKSDSGSEEIETDTGEENGASEETGADTGESGSASEETGTTNTGEENDASEETGTDTGNADSTSEATWTVTDELSGAVARAAQKTGASAFSVLGLSFDSAYTGEVTLSVAEYAQGDKVLLLQPTSAHSNTFVLADESMIDADGNVTLTVTDCTVAMLVMGLNGDVNGDGTVDTKDLLLIRRELCKDGTLTEVQRGFADYNLNGTLEARDLLTMTLYVDGKTGTSR